MPTGLTRSSAASRRPAARSSSRPTPSRAAAASISPIRTDTSWRCGPIDEEVERGAEPDPTPLCSGTSDRAINHIRLGTWADSRNATDALEKIKDKLK
ncbi:hypothetical protein MESS4_590014 [Mesorhizobium sp. STM 4661]|nr:hypothetical protein MESS4_590014 [Mesorhizobium sp. STM 4661]